MARSRPCQYCIWRCVRTTLIAMILTLLSSRAPILQPLIWVHRGLSILPRRVWFQPSSIQPSPLRRPLTDDYSGAQTGRCGFARRDRGEHSWAELVGVTRPGAQWPCVCKLRLKVWAIRDEKIVEKRWVGLTTVRQERYQTQRNARYSIGCPPTLRSPRATGRNKWLRLQSKFRPEMQGRAL